MARDERPVISLIATGGTIGMKVDPVMNAPVSSISREVLLATLCFFFNDTATTEIYTLSLHDALPILLACVANGDRAVAHAPIEVFRPGRSEEHTSELQSPKDLVCRLLLEKKKKK